VTDSEFLKHGQFDRQIFDHAESHIMAANDQYVSHAAPAPQDPLML